MRRIILFLLTFSCGLCSYASLAAAQPELAHFDIPEGRLAFTYTEKNSTDIFVIDFEKISVTPVLKTPAKEQHPRWSPDGTKLLFHSDASGNRDIYVSNSDGSNVSRVTKSKVVDEDADWSPDGTQIVFQRAVPRKGSHIFVSGLDGSKPRQLTSGASSNSFPRWSPRGNEILFTSNSSWPGWDVMLYEFETKKSRLLSHGNRSYSRAAWHPDGSKFAFSYGSGNDYDIWIQEKGSSTPNVGAKRPGRDYDAEWSDDGKRIFFAGELEVGKGNYQIFMLDVASRKVSQITEGNGSARHPSWTSLPSLETLAERVKSGKSTSPKTP